MAGIARGGNCPRSIRTEHEHLGAALLTYSGTSQVGALTGWMEAALCAIGSNAGASAVSESPQRTSGVTV